MKVQLCWRTDITPVGKINMTIPMTEKEAMQIYNRRRDLTEAYLQYSNELPHKTLKKRSPI